MYKYILGYCIFFVSATVSAEGLDHLLIAEFPDARLFHKEQQYFSRTTIPAAAIQYNEGEDPGYFSDSTLVGEGNTTLYVHDYSTHYTPEYLFDEFLAKAEASNFDIIYQCSGIDCGDLSGWRLFVSDHIHGEEASQGYILAQRRDLRGHHWFVQFHVTNLDREPRSVMRIIDLDRSPKLNLVFSGRGLPPETASTLDTGQPGTLYFDFDSARLPGDSRQTLEKIVYKITSMSVDEVFLSGYTDPVGGENYNRTLAARRATAVADALRKYEELNGVELVAKGYGETNQTESSDPEAYPRDRKVEVSLRQPDDSGDRK